MKSMTYGVMPSWSTFIAQYDHEMEGDRFRLHLKGQDARCVQAYGLDAETALAAREVYDYIDVLRIGWEKGDEHAGDVASSMLTTLGFEWV